MNNSYNLSALHLQENASTTPHAYNAINETTKSDTIA